MWGELGDKKGLIGREGLRINRKGVRGKKVWDIGFLHFILRSWRLCVGVFKWGEKRIFLLRQEVEIIYLWECIQFTFVETS